MKQFQFHSKVVLRTPLLPRRSSFSEKELALFFKDPLIQEAIYLSSPNLHSKLTQWQQKEITDQESIDSLLTSLCKYLLRMSNRCTPFGLFAGCSLMEWKEHSAISLSAPEKIIRKTRLDMKFIGEWIQTLEKEAALKDQLVYFSNQSIYEFQDKYRYIEFFWADGQKFHQISAIGQNEYVATILAAARAGASFDQLIQVLTQEDVPAEAAKDFLYQMIDAQLLLSELQANVTGLAPSLRMANILNHKSGLLSQTHQTSLKAIQLGLKKLDQQANNRRQDYENIQALIEPLQINFQEGKLFQTDYFRSLEKGHLSSRIKKDLRKACQILYQLNPQKKLPDLVAFQEAFLHRYEDEEVPLVEVLDTESGIGYPVQTTKIHTAFVDELPFPGAAEAAKITFDKWQNFLFGLAIKALQNKSYEIDLSAHQQEIEALKAAKPQALCPSLGIFFSILGKEGDREKILIKSISGPSNTKLVARFGNDFPAIKTLLEELANQEQEWYDHQEEIIAEVLHLPEARVGNVLFRPQLRKYEIPYLAKSTLPQDQQIAINDLMIAVRNGSIQLRSKRLNKKVNPIISCAHAYWQKALPLYHFLGDLQLQDQVTDLHFQWGSIGKKFPFLPRVKYQNIYLSPAQWNLSKADLAQWSEKTVSGMQTWCAQFQLPQKFFLVEDDNKLLIDTSNERSLKVFLDSIKNKDQISLEEELIDDSIFVKDGQGQAFNNELIAFINKRPEPNAKTSSFLKPAQTQVQRTFSPGSEWLYFKLYCGPQLGDTLLSELLFSFLQNPAHQNAIAKCFFIRYYDPDPHLRIRFLLKSADQFGSVTQAFQAYASNYRSKEIIRSIKIEEYKRELERYGHQSMEAVESIFYHDTLATIEFIKMLKEGLEEDRRPLFAIKSIDVLLEDFQFSLAQKIKLFEFLFKAFGAEFSINAHLRKEINKKYKDLHPSILAFLHSEAASFPCLPVVDAILKDRSQYQEKPIAQILSLAENQQLEMPLWDLVASLIHLLCNRLFIDKQRQHELLIYALLLKYYKEFFYRKH